MGLGSTMIFRARVRSLSLSLALLAFTPTLCVTGVARAEPSANEKAAAEALFQKASELMESGDAVNACEKYEASQQLDPALGTMLRIADCYERIGRTASAWAVFQQAAATAQRQGQTERHTIAKERADSLERRLSRISIVVPAGAREKGLEIKLNGTVIPSASWDAPLPVDPGTQRLEASATGYKPWSGSAEVAAGSGTTPLHVPELEALPEVPAAAEASVTPSLPSPTASGGNSLRTLGFVAGGIGVAGLAVSGLFAYSAYDKNEQSLEQCRQADPNACTPEGANLRERAQSSALGATIAGVAGGALLVTGVTLLIASPSRRNQEQQALRFYPDLGRRRGGLTVAGTF